jgi:hypothetical protein
LWILLALAWGCTPARAQQPSAPPTNMAILIVGDETSKVMRQREEEVVRLIRQSAREQGIPKEVLPILVYHLNKPAERSYCEKKLRITRKQILFLGLAEHKNLVVSRVLARENNVTDAEKGVVDLFRQVVAVYTGVPPEEQPKLPTYTPSPTTTPTETPGEDPDGTHVGSAVTCRSVDSSGAPRQKTEVFDPEDAFNVSMEVYGLQVGTKIETRWYRGKTLLDRKSILSDKIGDYYAWFTLPPGSGAWPAGRYQVSIFINGRYQMTVPFRVSDSD